jgi:hypothetical protein
VIVALLSQVMRLAPVLLLLLLLGFIAVRHQRVFLALFMLLTALENTRDFASSFDLALGAISIHPEDVVTVLCITVGLARIGRWRLQWITRTAALVYTLLIGLGAISWIWTFGLQHGTNSWRQEMLTVAVLLYATTRPRVWSWNDLQIIIVWPAIVVAIASGVGILKSGLGSSSSTIVVRGVLETGRPAFAPGSLLMLAGVWVTALSIGKWTATRVLVILLLGGMVLLTQNRSVWVSAILGVVVWWLVPRFSPRGRSSGLGRVSRTILVFFTAIATAFVGVSVAALGQSARNGDTWMWRVARWASSMSISRSWLEWLTGSAFGPTPASTPGRFPTFAHSFYVDTIEKTGFIGLAAVLCLLFAVGKAHVPPSVGPLGLILCVSLLGYGTTYQVPPWGWMLAGIFLASTREENGGSRHSALDTMRDLTEPGNPRQFTVDRAQVTTTFTGPTEARMVDRDH